MDRIKGCIRKNGLPGKLVFVAKDKVRILFTQQLFVVSILTH